jgi:N-acetyl-alpha-D-muramate 1-phosphate uridylyltransferase
VDVAGRPFVEHQLMLLRAHGLEDIVLLVGYLGEMVRDTLGDGSRMGMTIRYFFDGPTLLGTGGAVARALPALSDPFCVVYGDSYLECDYQDAIRRLSQSDALGLMTVCRNDNRWDRSNVSFAGGTITRYDKQTPTDDMSHIDYGLGVFRHAAFAAHPAVGAFDLAMVFQELLAAGRLIGYEVPGRFYEIGSPQGLVETDRYLTAKLMA